MTTTDVMEGENIGGLTRRHFLKMIGVTTGLAVGGLAAAALWPNKNDSPLQENPAVIVQAEEKSEKYKTIASKCAEQVEAGRKYVAEKYSVSPDQVATVLLDEIKQGYGPSDYNSPVSTHHNGRFNYARRFLPDNENGLFVAYAYQNGYAALVISRDIRIQKEHSFLFCDEDTKRVVELFLRKVSGREVAILDVGKVGVDSVKLRSLHGTKSPKSNELYEVHFTDGWDYRYSNVQSYAFDVGAKTILGEISPGVHILGEPCN